MAVDTTARGFLRSDRPMKVLRRELATALTPKKLKLADLALAKTENPVETYRIRVEGLG